MNKNTERNGKIFEEQKTNRLRMVLRMTNNLNGDFVNVKIDLKKKVFSEENGKYLKNNEQEIRFKTTN